MFVLYRYVTGETYILLLTMKERPNIYCYHGYEHLTLAATTTRGSYSTPASKSQDSADVPVKMTFRDQTALKLSASHYFSTWLLNVILRGISALHCLLAAAWVQSPCFSR